MTFRQNSGQRLLPTGRLRVAGALSESGADGRQAGCAGSGAKLKTMYITKLPPRGRLLGGLAAAGLANGLLNRVADAIASDGLAGAIAGTFGISALVWIAACVCVVHAWTAPRETPGRWDIVAAWIAAAMLCIPSDVVSWMTVSGVALYFIKQTAPSSSLRRAAVILLAITIPCFWSRIVFALLSGPILSADALLVSAVIGTQRTGNVFETIDGTGAIWIAPGCSSLANVSLTILCWTLFVNLYAGRRTAATTALVWCSLSAAVVIAINVGRMALVGLEPQLYDAVHGPVGGAIAGWLTLGAMVAITFQGIRHDNRARS